MNKKNEALKISTYSEFWEQSFTTQTRLLSTFDPNRGKFQLAFLEPKVPIPKSVEDYKTFVFFFDTKKIHPFSN